VGLPWKVLVEKHKRRKEGTLLASVRPMTPLEVEALFRREGTGGTACHGVTPDAARQNRALLLGEVMASIQTQWYRSPFELDAVAEKVADGGRDGELHLVARTGEALSANAGRQRLGGCRWETPASSTFFFPFLALKIFPRR
jgi:hypothetical protein